MISYDIDISTKAKFELNEAYNWYKYRLDGLGKSKFYFKVVRYLRLCDHTVAK